MSKDFLPYARHDMTDEDIAAVVDALRWDDLSGGGYIRKFEEALEERVGGKVVAVSSGTAALHLALMASGIGSQQPCPTVAVPALTFIATANAVVMAGGNPVFIDVQSDTWTIDPQAVLEYGGAAALEAVIGVDYAGLPADYNGLYHVMGDNEHIIADSCHSLGIDPDHDARLSCYSFHPAKHITSGEGGAVVTGGVDYADYDLIRALRNHGLDVAGGTPTLDRSYHRLGYNYRMTTVGAALAWSQLRRLDANLARRAALVQDYKDRIAVRIGLGSEGVTFQHIPNGMVSANHILPVLLPLGCDRRRVFEAMRAVGIGVQVHYRPVHLEPLYGGEDNRGMCPVAEGLYERMITLPLFPAMEEKDVVRVVEELRKAVMGL
ncbi:MAG: DegT/DnrJ/EryC1/StrS aminotransferase family protein [Dehalococcoidia bacterium]|nr:DegT/DnrJ/EryC1/StrS aminotransferase family protein [Dehalococcoidia bacterium]